VSNGEVRPIGVTSPQRSPALSGIPAIAETVPGYRVESWYGIYAPAGTPPDVIAKLNATIGKIAKTDEFRKRVEPEGLVISAGAPAELDEFVRAEEAIWRRIVTENNIRSD
jgi:tripartite-type tricarboxylate transporter receptor subunit TctC